MSAAWIAIAHAIAGRTRLRSPLLRRDPRRCEQLADALAARPGVREVAVRPYSGSVLILHATTVAAATLAADASRVLDGARVLAPGEPPPVTDEMPPLSSV